MERSEKMEGWRKGEGKGRRMEGKEKVKEEYMGRGEKREEKQRKGRGENG